MMTAEGGRRKAERAKAESGRRAPAPRSAISHFSLRIPHSAPHSSLSTLHSPLPTPHSSLSTRFAFTLVELLVVITIITILAGILMFALSAAQEAARAQRTKALVAKLDTLIRARYDAFRTRRVPLRFGPAPKPSDSNYGTYVWRVARARLDALREIMRMELPERWNDINDDPIVLKNADGQPLRTSLSRRYKQRFDAVVARQTADQKTRTTGHQGAECLYMILTTGQGDELGGEELFSEADVGDADSDGFPEFHDGWGNPIRFLRWAPGFDSELQRVSRVDPKDPMKDPPSIFPPDFFSNLQPSKPRPEKWGDPFKDHDPFDPRRVAPEAFALYPLIYSAGPDEIFDINNIYLDSNQDDDLHYGRAPYNNDPYFIPPAGKTQMGTPADAASDKFGAADGVDNSLDNIHNHLITAQ